MDLSCRINGHEIRTTRKDETLAGVGNDGCAPAPKANSHTLVLLYPRMHLRSHRVWQFRTGRSVKNQWQYEKRKCVGHPRCVLALETRDCLSEKQRAEGWVQEMCHF